MKNIEESQKSWNNLNLSQLFTIFILSPYIYSLLADKMILENQFYLNVTGTSSDYQKNRIFFIS